MRVTERLTIQVVCKKIEKMHVLIFGKSKDASWCCKMLQDFVQIRSSMEILQINKCVMYVCTMYFIIFIITTAAFVCQYISSQNFPLGLWQDSFHGNHQQYKLQLFLISYALKFLHERKESVG